MLLFASGLHDMIFSGMQKGGQKPPFCLSFPFFMED
jgi:hypothetical protein